MLAFGDQDKSEILSSGGDVSVTSFESSPVTVVVVGAELERPKSEDILMT